jgi:HK97 gp10 family phage protein
MSDDGGIGKLQRRLAAIPKAAKEATMPALLKQAEAMAETMRTLVPVDTGHLRDSITVTPGGEKTPAYSQPGGASVVPENAAAVTVGDHTVRYGHLVEYGTTKAHAHPFFWPAVRLHNKKAKAAIRRAIGKAIRGARG